MLISYFKYANLIIADWDIDSYNYVNEYGELILIFMLFSFDRRNTVISNYKYKFGKKLLEFLGVNTKLGFGPGVGLYRAYDEDLKKRQFILGELTYQIEKTKNMYDYDKKPFQFTKREEEQDEWDMKRCIKEGRQKYLKECESMNIVFDDYE